MIHNDTSVAKLVGGRNKTESGSVFKEGNSYYLNGRWGNSFCKDKEEVESKAKLMGLEVIWHKEDVSSEG